MVKMAALVRVRVRVRVSLTLRMDALSY